MSPKTIPSAPRDSAAIPAWCAGSRGWPLTASASGPDGLRLAGEERGADRAAEIAELGEEHRRWAVVREDVGEHRVLEPLAIRVAETHAEPAAEHDRLDVEQVHRRGDAGAERRDGAVDEPHRHRVLAHQRAGPDATGQAFASPLLHDLEEVRLLALADELASAGLHRAAARVGLHAALAAAGALRSAHLDHHVADLARGVAAEPELAVEHDAAADARAPEHAEQRAVAPAGAERRLGHGGDVDVVAERHGRAEIVLQCRGERERALPAGQVARARDRAALVVHVAGRAHADRGQLARVRAGGRGGAADRLGDRGGDVRRAARRRGRRPLVADDGVALVHDDRLDLRATEVDARAQAHAVIQPRSRALRRALEDHDRDLALRPALVVVVVGPDLGHLTPQLGPLLGRRVPRARPELVVADLDLHLGVLADVEVPGRVLGRAALRGDDHRVVACHAVDERAAALRAGLAACGGEDQRRGAALPVVPALAAGLEVGLHVGLAVQVGHARLPTRFAQETRLGIRYIQDGGPSRNPRTAGSTPRVTPRAPRERPSPGGPAHVGARPARGHGLARPPGGRHGGGPHRAGRARAGRRLHDRVVPERRSHLRRDDRRARLRRTPRPRASRRGRDRPPGDAGARLPVREALARRVAPARSDRGHGQDVGRAPAAPPAPPHRGRGPRALPPARRHAGRLAVPTGGRLGGNVLTMKEQTAPRRYRQRRRAAAAEANTERIMQAALDLFVERPLDQITLAEVAERAGVGLQTLIRRVGTKDGLARAVNEWTVPQVAVARGEPVSSDPRQVATALARHYERWGASTDRMLRQEDASPALAEAAAAGRRAHREWVEAAFACELAGLAPAARANLLARL